MNELQRLVDRCKAGVSLEVNDHRNYYMTVATYVKEAEERRTERQKKDPLVEPAVLAEMIRKDVVVELQFYPQTPIGFWKVWHHDVEAAVKRAHELLDMEDAERCKTLATGSGI